MRDEELEREPAGDAGTENVIEGRNAVIEAFRAGKPIDKLFVLDGAQDGPIQTIKREAKKRDTMIRFVTKERLDQPSETGKHQGVIAYAAAYEYAEVEDILAAARAKDEPPFIILLDNIEDPHNLGAIIRTANLAARRHHPKEPGGGADRGGGEDFGGGVELHAGREGDKPWQDDGGAQKGRALVCLCGHGRHDDVRS